MSTLVEQRTAQHRLPVRAATDRGRTVAAPEAAAIAGLTLLAFAIRYAFALRSGLFRDEAQLVDIASLPSWRAMLDFLRLHESHPPLFYAIVRVWSERVGASDAALLVLAALLGAAVVPAIWAVGRRMTTPATGIIAAVLAAVAPPLVLYGGMLRPYSFLAALALLSTLALWSAAGSGARRAWLGYVAATAAMLWTHNWAVLIVAAQWAVAIAWIASGRDRRLARGWLAAQLGVLALWAPWLPALLHQARHAGYPPADVSVAGRALLGTVMLAQRGFGVVAAGPAAGGAWLSPAIVVYTCLGVALAALTAIHAARRGAPAPARRAAALLLGTPLLSLLLAVVLSGRSNLLQEHCFTIAAPLLLLATAWGVGLLWDASRAAGLAAAALPAVAAVAFLAAGVVAPKTNARELAAIVGAQLQPGDVVLEVPGNAASGLNRYLPQGAERIDYPAAGREQPTRYEGYWARMWDDASVRRTEDALRPAIAAGRRVWLVGYDAQLREPAPARADAGFRQVGHVRVSELARWLRAEYGAPGLLVGYRAGSAEQVAALRFDPAPAAARGVRAGR